MFETMAKVQYSLKPKNEVPETSVLKSFSWDGYISGTDDKPAPRSCFKQTMDPPPNEFKAGMKLESRDPRNTMSFCIATVIYASGPRLCLRLDGSDNRNDFWSLVDSGDIHPYGWCAEQGDQLQPPLGFAKNSSYFPLFLSKLLQESKDLMAPSSCFKTVPVGPERNMFEVGMKLEAIDTKNPYLIAPATIGNVDGDKVYIQFDGWKGAFDYWCRYDSRNIFPVGWCAAAGHILQFPGGRGNAPRARGSSSSKSQSVSPNIAVHVDTQLPHSVGEPSPGSVKSAGTTSKKNSPAVSAASTTVAVAQKLLSPETPISPAAVNGDTVTAYVNQTCRCGPLLNQTRIIRLPLHYGPGVVSRMLKKIIQALVDSAVNPAQIFNNLVTSASSSTITAKISGKVTTCTIPAVSTEEEFTDYISNTLQSIECCVNLITLQPLRQICDKCSVSTSVSNHSLKRAYSTIDGSVTAGGKKRRAYRTMSVPVGRGRGRKRRGSLRHDMNANITSPSASAPFSPRLDSQMTSPVSVTDLTDIAANPYDWSADEVIRYVRCKDPSLSKQAHLIKKHEIDGRAFLLMTSDIAIKYMQMKVGPALKMCSLIDQLRLSMRY